jgi:succinoglycan biosynthesis protein ExoA
VNQILCYHDVGDTGFPGPVAARYKLTANQFERHLDALEGIPDVTLTFDDGGASALAIADALERRGRRGQFFIVTGQLGTSRFLDADGVRELAARGHAVGSHSHTHPAYIERLAAAELEREWRTSRERLGDVLGQAPRIAAVPGGRLSVALIEEVAAAGYELLLSCEPTARARRHGRLTVRGRYTIWSTTGCVRVTAYARGGCSARLMASARWRIKRAARTASPAYYERARRARASLGDEARNLGGLSLERHGSGTLEPGGHEPLAQRPVIEQPLDGAGGGDGVVGGNEQRAVAERADAADSGGDRRQPAGIGLDQDLREPLGPGDVQEHVTRAVQIEQSSVERNVTPQLAVICEPELLDARAELVREVALAADDQPPARVAVAQQLEHVSEQQRVLLGVDPADREQAEPLGVVAAPGGPRTGLEVGGADQRHGGVQDARRAPVAHREVGPDGEHRDAPGERTPAALEHGGGEPQRAAPRMAVADIRREVLADAEHQPPAPEQRHQRERDRMRVRPERQNGIGVVERPPHARDRARHGAQHRPELRQPRVVRERHELDRIVELVTSPPTRLRPAVEAAEQPQPADLLRERPQEAHEGALSEHLTVALPVEVVGVDDERHGRRSAPSRPAVSVLIPVLDEAGVLERTVPTMLSQRLDDEIEFLFAEGRSRDGSRAALARFAAQDPRVRVLENPSGRTPDALNMALAAARGTYVARMDAHCFYPPSYLADGIARLERGDVAWVAGPAIPRGDGGFSGTVALALCSPLGRGPSRRLAHPGALGQRECELDTGVFAGVWRRSALERHGGWDARWLRNQDSELAARFLAAGERIVSLPSMAAEYVPRRTLAAFLRQYHDYGRYRALTLARHPLARRRSHALAPALVGTFALAACSPRSVRTAARAAIGAYAIAVAAETARATRTAPRRDAVGLPLAFAAMHVGWGSGMWRGLIAAGRARQSFFNGNH